MIIDVVRVYLSGRPVYGGCRGKRVNAVQPTVCKAGAHYLKSRPKKPKPPPGPKRKPGRPRKYP